MSKLGRWRLRNIFVNLKLMRQSKAYRMKYNNSIKNNTMQSTRSLHEAYEGKFGSGQPFSLSTAFPFNRIESLSSCTKYPLRTYTWLICNFLLHFHRNFSERNRAREKNSTNILVVSSVVGLGNKLSVCFYSLHDVDIFSSPG